MKKKYYFNGNDQTSYFIYLSYKNFLTAYFLLGVCLVLGHRNYINTSMASKKPVAQCEASVNRQLWYQCYRRFRTEDLREHLGPSGL